MNYEEAYIWLTRGLYKSDKFAFNAIKDLDSIRKILSYLGNPEDSVPAIHVAATSGKGSICYGLQSALLNHGKTTVMITSPHIYDVRERVQINGKIISKKEFALLAAKIKDALAETNTTASFFSAMTFMGFLAAARHKPDYLIVETGCGGLKDTTNVITRDDKLALVGRIGLDHQAILGDTIEEIAVQKAGISTTNYSYFLAQGATVDPILSQKAKPVIAQHLDGLPKDAPTKENSSLIMCAMYQLSKRDKWELSVPKTIESIKNLSSPGRQEILKLNEKTVILDGAHNPQKIRGLCDKLLRRDLDRKYAVIFTCGRKKNASEMLSILKPICNHLYLTTYISNETDLLENKASKISDLQTAALKVGYKQSEITVIDTPTKIEQTIQNDNQDHWLITGSGYLLQFAKVK